MLIVYGALASPFVARCVLALRRKGLEHRMVLPPGGLKSPEFLKLSPFGKIPVLVDGEMALPESEVICEYIEERYPEPPLLPRDAASRAHSRLVSRIVDLYLIPAVFALSRQSDPTRRDETIIAVKLADYAHAIDALEQVMEAGPYAIGESFTLADCTLITILFHVMRVIPDFVPEPFGGHPKLETYQAFIAGEESFAALQAEIQAAWTEMVKQRG